MLGAGGAGATDAVLGVLGDVDTVPPAHPTASLRACLPASPVLCSLQALTHCRGSTLSWPDKQFAGTGTGSCGREHPPHSTSLLTAARFKKSRKTIEKTVSQASTAPCSQVDSTRWTALKHYGTSEHKLQCPVTQHALSLPIRHIKQSVAQRSSLTASPRRRKAVGTARSATNDISRHESCLTLLKAFNLSLSRCAPGAPGKQCCRCLARTLLQ